MTGDTPPSSWTAIAKLLHELCTEAGFCLPPGEALRLEQHPPPTIDMFTDAVFVAEGLDPRTADKQLWRRVRERVAKYISDALIDVDAAHGHSSNHRVQIEASDRCGCFHCLTIFPPQAILDWVDDGSTALCPHCGIDAVIGSRSGVPITPEFLKHMNLRWF